MDAQEPKTAAFSPRAVPGAACDFAPSAGQLLLFPPWQLHSVLPSTYQGDRGTGGGENGGRPDLKISWAFNVLIKTRKIPEGTGGCCCVIWQQRFRDF
jgi:hypothetical protein